jgi:hypothetical protein
MMYMRFLLAIPSNLVWYKQFIVLSGRAGAHYNLRILQNKVYTPSSLLFLFLFLRCGWVKFRKEGGLA